jgi:DNA polymerase III delta subunit
MIIIHGNDTTLSRQKLTGLVDQFQGELIRLDGRQCSLGEFKQALESESLFENERKVVIENIFSRPTGKEKELLMKYLKNVRPANVICWEGKKIDGRTLKAFAKSQIISFNLQPVIFQFLDSVFPDNQPRCLTYLHQVLKTEAPELVFFLLAGRIRDLLIAQSTGHAGLTKKAPWQQSKLIRQAEFFEPSRLLKIHRHLLEIDRQIKTGQTPFDLKSHLDLLIASI